jgi:hypothetical protein
MKFLRGKTQQLLQAMDFVNIDRLDELDHLLEQREASSEPCRGDAAADEISVRRRDFGDGRVIDLLSFARRTALASSGRGG